MSNSIASRPKISRIAWLLALACALTGLGPVALADADDVIVQRVTVSYGDLNLQTESGARQLIKRLNTAAAKACGGRPTPGPLEPIVHSERRFKACRSTAVQTAVGTLNRPTVTSVYLDGRTTGNRVATR